MISAFHCAYASPAKREVSASVAIPRAIATAASPTAKAWRRPATSITAAHTDAPTTAATATQLVHCTPPNAVSSPKLPRTALPVNIPMRSMAPMKWAGTPVPDPDRRRRNCRTAIGAETGRPGKVHSAGNRVRQQREREQIRRLILRIEVDQQRTRRHGRHPGRRAAAPVAANGAPELPPRHDRHRKGGCRRRVDEFKRSPTGHRSNGGCEQLETDRQPPANLVGKRAVERIFRTGWDVGAQGVVPEPRDLRRVGPTIPDGDRHRRRKPDPEQWDKGDQSDGHPDAERPRFREVARGRRVPGRSRVSAPGPRPPTEDGKGGQQEARRRNRYGHDVDRDRQDPDHHGQAEWQDVRSPQCIVAAQQRTGGTPNDGHQRDGTDVDLKDRDHRRRSRRR